MAPAPGFALALDPVKDLLRRHPRRRIIVQLLHQPGHRGKYPSRLLRLRGIVRSPDYGCPSRWPGGGSGGAPKAW